MKDSPYHVCISLLNWNSPAQTVACLSQFDEQTYRNFSIIVVDNASHDDSVAKIRAAFPQIELIAAKENLGYAGGHRLSLEKALQREADLLWILNTDLELEPASLEELVTAYQSQGNALYGSVPLKANGKSRIGGFTGWELNDFGQPDYDKPLSFLGKPYDDFFGENQNLYQVSTVAGSSMLVPLDVVKQHGFMNEEFFLYSEELDYCLRLHQKGVPSYIVPKSRVAHEYAGTYKSRTRLRTIVNYYYERNRLIIMRRYMGNKRYNKQIIKETRKCLKEAAKFIIRHRSAPSSLELSCRCLAVFDAAFNRMGKRFAPEDYLD